MAAEYKVDSDDMATEYRVDTDRMAAECRVYSYCCLLNNGLMKQIRRHETLRIVSVLVVSEIFE
jgi:hypothetical protein